MSDNDSLWPSTFKVDVQSPLSILKAQASALASLTNGILQGTVETVSAEKTLQHRLIVLAPAYHQYRHTLLTAKHQIELPYPTTVVAETLAEQVERIDPVFGRTSVTVFPKASSDEDFRRLVRKALASDATEAVILSLIAKSNESIAAADVPEAAKEGEE